MIDRVQLEEDNMMSNIETVERRAITPTLNFIIVPRIEITVCSTQIAPIKGFEGLMNDM